jgi:hypothetical protein
MAASTNRRIHPLPVPCHPTSDPHPILLDKNANDAFASPFGSSPHCFFSVDPFRLHCLVMDDAIGSLEGILPASDKASKSPLGPAPHTPFLSSATLCSYFPRDIYKERSCESNGALAIVVAPVDCLSDSTNLINILAVPSSKSSSFYSPPPSSNVSRLP